MGLPGPGRGLAPGVSENPGARRERVRPRLAVRGPRRPLPGPRPAGLRPLSPAGAPGAGVPAGPAPAAVPPGEAAGVRPWGRCARAASGRSSCRAGSGWAGARERAGGRGCPARLLSRSVVAFVEALSLAGARGARGRCAASLAPGPVPLRGAGRAGRVISRPQAHPPRC